MRKIRPSFFENGKLRRTVSIFGAAVLVFSATLAANVFIATRLKEHSLYALFVFSACGLIIAFCIMCYALFRLFFRRHFIQESLQSEHTLLQTLMDAIPTPILYKDTEFRYLGCNRAFEAFCGSQREILINKTALEVFPPERAKGIHERDSDFLASNKNQDVMEISLMDRGEMRNFEITRAKFYHADGALGGCVTIIFDITDRKNLEQGLRQANQQLTQKNDQLTAGIEYASRIQGGILADPEEIIEPFQDAFIFFRPRDILSGDFYWFAKKDDLLMIAAVDCTGHGVPGALMTVLGNELLNQIVYAQNIIRPDLILFTLDLKLRVALQKRIEEEEISDGMELGLCVVDLKTKELQFAGAKRSLCKVNAGKLEEIKGSNAPIGGHARKNKAFHLHTQQIQEGDAFYIFTDGFQDQFGGPQKQKFMVKQFKTLLEEISSLSLKEQKNKLAEKFEEWKGNEPQTDDVLVIGMKFF